MESLNDFMADHQGKPLEVEDPNNKDQCFDLAFGWTDNLGIPREAIRHLFAYQIFTNPVGLTYEHFDVIPNTPTNVPQAGDLVVFGSGVGKAGHVSIFINGSTQGFRSFDQNWDTAHNNAGTDDRGNLIPVCCVIEHNYDYVLGWLHPKVLTQEQDMFTNPTNGDTRDAQGWYNAYAERDKQWNDDEHLIGDLKMQITAQQTEIGRLNGLVNQPAAAALPAPPPVPAPPLPSPKDPLSEPYRPPINGSNDTSSSGSSFGSYNKFWVGLAGVVVQVALGVLGMNDPLNTTAAAALTALGVLNVKNKG